MSYYYKYKFISPEAVYARVKEDLQSYFDTGIIDDVLFPKYTEYCLKKLGRVTYKVVDIPLEIQNFQATLPEDFVGVRELFACVNITRWHQNPSATYTQITSQVTPVLDACTDCEFVDEVVTMKTTGQWNWSYQIGGLLKPANIGAIGECKDNCGNLYSNSPDSYDIHGNKLVVNFEHGAVHLVYYKREVDENEYQLIPDVEEFIDWLEHYIKFKCFETIFNKVTDESFNQVNVKYQMYKQLQAVKKVIAETEFKKQNIYDVRRSILKSYNSFNHYDRMLWGRRSYKRGW